MLLSLLAEVGMWQTCFALLLEKNNLFFLGLLVDDFVVSVFPNELYQETQISGSPREE